MYHQGGSRRQTSRFIISTRTEEVSSKENQKGVCFRGEPFLLNMTKRVTHYYSHTSCRSKVFSLVILSARNIAVTLSENTKVHSLISTEVTLITSTNISSFSVTFVGYTRSLNIHFAFHCCVFCTRFNETFVKF